MKEESNKQERFHPQGGGIVGGAAMSEEYVIIVEGGRVYHRPCWIPDTVIPASYRLGTVCRIVDVATHNLTLYLKSRMEGTRTPCKRCYNDSR